jgi:hypothetical protein
MSAYIVGTRRAAQHLATRLLLVDGVDNKALSLVPCMGWCRFVIAVQTVPNGVYLQLFLGSQVEIEYSLGPVRCTRCATAHPPTRKTCANCMPWRNSAVRCTLCQFRGAKTPRRIPIKLAHGKYSFSIAFPPLCLCQIVTALPRSPMTSPTTSPTTPTILAISHANENGHVLLEMVYIQKAYKAPHGAYDTFAPFPRFLFSFPT